MKTKTKIIHTIVVGVLITFMFLIFPLNTGVTDIVNVENIREIEFQRENDPPPYQGIILLFAIFYLFLIWASNPSNYGDSDDELKEIVKSLRNKS